MAVCPVWGGFAVCSPRVVFVNHSCSGPVSWRIRDGALDVGFAVTNEMGRCGVSVVVAAVVTSSLMDSLLGISL